MWLHCINYAKPLGMWLLHVFPKCDTWLIFFHEISNPKGHIRPMEIARKSWGRKFNTELSNEKHQPHPHAYITSHYVANMSPYERNKVMRSSGPRLFFP